MLSSWSLFEPLDRTPPQAKILDISFFGGATESDSVAFGVSLEVPDACYEVKKLAFRYNKDRKAFLIYPELRRLKSISCTDLKRVEKVMINFGHLIEGRYEIRELVSLKRWAKFDIFKDSISDQVLVSFNKSR